IHEFRCVNADLPGISLGIAQRIGKRRILTVASDRESGTHVPGSKIGAGGCAPQIEADAAAADIGIARELTTHPEGLRPYVPRAWRSMRCRRRFHRQSA